MENEQELTTRKARVDARSDGGIWSFSRRLRPAGAWDFITLALLLAVLFLRKSVGLLEGVQFS